MASSTPPPEAQLKDVGVWFKEHKGAHDWLFLFDGRNRETANKMQDAMQGRQHGTELLLLYSASAQRSEAGRTRKVALAASNVERLFLFPPCARTALAAKPRTNFIALGESSTHDAHILESLFARGNHFREFPKITKQILSTAKRLVCRSSCCNYFRIRFCFGKKVNQWTCSNNC